MYIDKNGDRWYRGNLHTHTTLSDGVLSPETVKAKYREMGYDFIALCDHWHYGEGTEQDPSGLLVLSGIEYNFNDIDVLKGVYHILSIGALYEPEVEKSDTAQSAIDKINAAGGFPILAHPAWSMNTYDMITCLSGIFATEIYNSLSGVPFNCRPYSGEVVDQLAARGYYLSLVADDDSHFYRGEEGMSYIMVNLGQESLTTENLLSAIRAGRYIATQGPMFDFTLEGDEAVLRSETPLSLVTFFTNRVYEEDRCTIMTDKPLYEARFKIKYVDTFVRAECTAVGGGVGYSKIIPLKK